MIRLPRGAQIKGRYFTLGVPKTREYKGRKGQGPPSCDEIWARVCWCWLTGWRGWHD